MDEPDLIEEVLTNLAKGCAHLIVLVDNETPSKELELIQHYTKLVMITERIVDFAEARNRMQEWSPTKWVFHADMDEMWKDDFVYELPQLAERMTAMGHFAVRFKRYNLPRGRDYPDYQVRLLDKDVCIWKRPVHEIPYHRELGKPVDQVNFYSYGREVCQHLADASARDRRLKNERYEEIEEKWSTTQSKE